METTINEKETSGIVNNESERTIKDNSTQGVDSENKDLSLAVALLSVVFTDQIKCIKFHRAMSRKVDPAFYRVGNELTRRADDIIRGILAAEGSDDEQYRKAILMYARYAAKVASHMPVNGYHGYVWSQGIHSVISAANSLFCEFREAALKTLAGVNRDPGTRVRYTEMLAKYWNGSRQWLISAEAGNPPDYSVEMQRFVSKAYAKLRKRGLCEYEAEQMAWKQQRAA
jgi:hypothetical protein